MNAESLETPLEPTRPIEESIEISATQDGDEPAEGSKEHTKVRYVLPTSIP